MLVSAGFVSFVERFVFTAGNLPVYRLGGLSRLL